MNNLSMRLQQARKAAGLSLRALGELVSLSHAAIKKYEDGEVYPSSELLLKLAKALKVRIDFFFRPTKVSLQNTKFRKRSKLGKKAEDAIKFAVIEQIERRLELENLYPSSPIEPFKLPEKFSGQISSFEELEPLAEKLRNFWKLGLDPIYNLIDALENQGVRVFIVDSEEDYFDGLSTVINKEPIIVVSSKWPKCRQRFNLMHELAHYVLMDRLSPELDEEKACHRFAAAFLFPKAAVVKAMGIARHALDLQELILAKEQFQLSIGAICYRLKDLKIIQEPYWKKLRIEFGKKGWNKKEPGGELPSEKNHVFDQMLFHALSEKYIGESKAAELLCCSLDQLKARRQGHNGQVFTRQRR